MEQRIRGRRGLLLGVALFLTTLACGGSDEDGSRPPLGQPIAGLTTGQWSWVPFPDSTCGDGSTTGIGVNPGTGPDVVFFLDGGGACSSGTTCFILQTAVLGPFGEAQFNTKSATVAGTILDRALAGSPFSDATLVYFPYCTGDVHGGNRVVTYTDGPGGTVNHTGRTNVVAYMKRVAATFPSARRLVVSGSSGGGFGTLVNYELIRSYYPAAQGFAVDDSGPPLESNGGPLIQGGFQSWGISEVLDPLCGGPGVCQADLSRGLAALAGKHPADRFALLSWTVDPTIAGFYFITLPEFTAELLQMTTDVIDPAPNARAFIAVGVDHTMLGQVGDVTQNGVPLVTWLTQQVTGSTDWVSVKP